jgi:hypothetical protein
MLADGAEATVRARHPATIEDLDSIVGESIQNRILSGQLDDCPLTLADLAAIRRAFVDVLRGLHHPRVAYPGEAASVASAGPGVATPQEWLVDQAAAHANGSDDESAEEPSESIPDGANGTRSF